MADFFMWALRIKLGSLKSRAESFLQLCPGFNIGNLKKDLVKHSLKVLINDYDNTSEAKCILPVNLCWTYLCPASKYHVNFNAYTVSLASMSLQAMHFSVTVARAWTQLYWETTLLNQTREAAPVPYWNDFCYHSIFYYYHNQIKCLSSSKKKKVQ